MLRYSRIYRLPKKNQDTLQGEIGDKKLKVYKEYDAEISELIAKIEVYAHDLPRQVSGIIESLFVMLTSAASESTDSDELEWYDKIEYQEIFLKNILYVYLIDIYMTRVKKYRKVLRKFNHQTILTEEHIPFMDAVNPNLKAIAREYRKKNCVCTIP